MCKSSEESINTNFLRNTQRNTCAVRRAVSYEFEIITSLSIYNVVRGIIGPVTEYKCGK